MAVRKLGIPARTDKACPRWRHYSQNAFAFNCKFTSFFAARSGFRRAALSIALSFRKDRVVRAGIGRPRRLLLGCR